MPDRGPHEAGTAGRSGGLTDLRHTFGPSPIGSIHPAGATDTPPRDLRAAGSRGVSGLVLAGGRSTRFGRDKLREPVDGRPLLHLAVLALAAVCDEVIVAGPRDASALPQLPEVQVPLRVVRDAEAGGGPLVGLRAGLEAARFPIVLVAGGDMPHLVQPLLRELVRALASGADAAVLREDGELRPLPCAIRISALPVLVRQLATGRRSLREFLAALPAQVIEEPVWRTLDPAGASLRDVDRPEDLG